MGRLPRGGQALARPCTGRRGHWRPVGGCGAEPTGDLHGHFRGAHDALGLSDPADRRAGRGRASAAGYLVVAVFTVGAPFDSIGATKRNLMQVSALRM